MNEGVALMEQQSMGFSATRPMDVKGAKIAPEVAEDESVGTKSSIYFKFPFLLKKWAEIDSYIGQTLFPGLPSQYNLRKRLIIHRSIAQAWAVWDTLQIFLITIACGIYIASVYPLPYTVNKSVQVADLVVCQFFLMDFLVNWFMHPKLGYFADYMVLVDLGSMLPVYVSLFLKANVTLDFFKCLRVLRLVRLIKNYKYMHTIGGVARQVVYLTITLFIVIFLSSCLVQFLENHTHVQLTCQFINANTDWEPSCVEDAPADDICLEDCRLDGCNVNYGYHDPDGQPSSVRCSRLTFFNAFYYIIITLSTIGYGDVRLASNYARGANILFIFSSLVLIPMRISELQVLLSLTNPYSKPYVPQNNDSHVVITGYVSDKKKLQTFLKEFFHPDRVKNAEDECHVVILASHPPSEDTRSLLLSNSLEARVTWVMGTPLSITDLKKVRADTAKAMFFLVSTDLHEMFAKVEDASNVLSALSVTNFNSNLFSFVQVLRPENGDILQDSEVDMILCLDEYKTAVQARNAICPGFSTFIENIFHSMGNVSPEIEQTMPPWYDEYLHGAGMELYFVHLPEIFLKAMRYSFVHIVEVIYVEWGCITLGMCRDNRSNVVFNPLTRDLFEFADIQEFYSQFNTALIMADDQHQADLIESQLTKPNIIYDLIMKVVEEEMKIPCSNKDNAHGSPHSSASPTNLHVQNKKSPQSKFKSAARLVTNLVHSGEMDAEAIAEESMKLQHAKKRFKVPSLDAVKRSQQRSEKGAHLADAVNSVTFARKFHSRDSFKISSVFDSDSDGYISEEEDGSSDDEDDESTYIGFNKNKALAADLREARISSRAGRSKAGQDDSDSSDDDEGSDKFDDKSKEGDSKSGHVSASESEEDWSEDEDAFGGLAPPSHEIATLLQSQKFQPGQPSAIVRDANMLMNHVIVTTAESNLLMFVQELRRPCIIADSYHPILIVHKEKPLVWNFIANTYNDIYLFIGDPSKPSNLKLLGFQNAFSVALMGNRDTLNKVDGQTVNTGTLFSFLKVESLVPSKCYLTVELTSSNNMSVLNATMMRRQTELLVASQNRAGTVRDTLISNQHSHPSQIAHTNIRKKGISDRGTSDENESDKLVRDKRRHAALFEDMHGRFATKRSTSIMTGTPDNNQVKLPGVPGKMNTAELIDKVRAKNQSNEPQVGNKHRRGSVTAALSKVTNAVMDVVGEAEALFTSSEDLEELWDAMDSYHVLPVFASAKAFVPSSFESLLVQSYYVKITPIVCEKFVCGQLAQTMMCIDLPKDLIGWKFQDLFRLFISHQVLVLGLYRAPQAKLGALLPYVYTSPPPHVCLAAGDKVYVYSTHSSVRRAKLGVTVIKQWGVQTGSS